MNGCFFYGAESNHTAPPRETTLGQMTQAAPSVSETSPVNESHPLFLLGVRVVQLTNINKHNICKLIKHKVFWPFVCLPNTPSKHTEGLWKGNGSWTTYNNPKQTLTNTYIRPAQHPGRTLDHLSSQNCFSIIFFESPVWVTLLMSLHSISAGLRSGFCLLIIL